MKRCCICQQVKPLGDFHKQSSAKDGRQSRCKPCALAVVAKWQKDNRPASRANKARYKRSEKGRVTEQRYGRVSYRRNHAQVLARRAVEAAVRRGKLERWPCMICGNPEVEGHHPDYSNRLGVVWLCHEHHHQLHAEAALYVPGNT